MIISSYDLYWYSIEYVIVCFKEIINFIFLSILPMKGRQICDPETTFGKLC